jgi:predicted secreted hydrolase/threonine/homoserine/homoserine lactone efflux protein
LNLFLRGLLIGFSIAAPVGPIGVLCIRRTLANGRISGFISGLGAATADALYGSIAALGLTFIAGFLVAQQVWLRLIGGIFLIYLAIKMFREKPVLGNLGGEPYAEQGSSLPGKRAAAYSRRELAVDYASTLLLTLTNPVTILSFVAIFAGLGLAGQGYAPGMAMWMVGGVFLGSTTWWLLLSSLAGALRQRFLRPQGLLWVNRLAGGVILVFGLLALASAVPGLLAARQGSSVPATLQMPAPVVDASAFSRADGSYVLSFPLDHGPHPDFQTEWWYYTGNLEAEGGRHFGFQLTFFRRALQPPSQAAQRPSEWAASQVYMAHFALSDVAGVHYHAFEIRERGAAGLAGAQAAPFQVWLDDWQIEETAPGVYHLAALQDGIRLDLLLSDQKSPVLQGVQGYSRKGPQVGQASYYYSLTRLSTSGTVLAGGAKYAVSGLSWMDHEFSTSVLSEDQVGWDWFSVQLDDGSELMVFHLRKADGSIDPFSSGTLIAPDGSSTHLNREDFELTALDTWKSPHTQALYPARWTLRVPVAGLDLTIVPYLADQELNVSYAYWEGCVRIQGTRDGKPVQGSGYVELTGYAGSLAGDF